MDDDARTHGACTHATMGDEPIRDEILSPERLWTEAAEIAKCQSWSTKGRLRSTPLLPIIERASAQLSANNGELATLVRGGVPASPATDWLLDNYYLIEEQLLVVTEDLPANYATELPRITDGPMAGFPRIYEALIALIAHTDSRVDEDSLVGFADAYQQLSALTIGEVWAIPIMLRIGIVENLRRLSSSTLESMEAERDASLWAERLVLASQDEPEHVPDLLRDVEKELHDKRFWLRLSMRLADLEASDPSVDAWVATQLRRRDIQLDVASVAEQQLQAANQVSIANSISTIRFLDALEWRRFFERVSLVEVILSTDPAQVYATMDFLSRDRYRHALEQLARRSATTEIALAEKIVLFARDALAADPTDFVRGHVGWWLIDGGRYELEQAIGYPKRFREWLYRGPLSHHVLYYGGSLALFTALLLAMVAAYAVIAGASTPAIVALLVLTAVPLSEISVTVVNRLSSLMFPARVLPKLDFRSPIAESHRTLVVVPALLSSVTATRSVLDKLEVAYLANRDINIGFALLGDLRAAGEKSVEGDESIVEVAAVGIGQLNDRYQLEHGVRPFHLLMRDRMYNESEGVWMGWERKRGALVELVREMRAESRPTSFAKKLGDAEFRQSCAFVITLDADTTLPRDGARKLVATIAHPLNRASYKPGDTIVECGYGLVQPRVDMTLPGSRRSRFAYLYSGVTGVDPYAQAVSDTYQDVFGEGSFTGKGIFEVDIFQGMLDGLFPENTLLSHDLVEGSFLRTALASDIEVLDDYPSNYLAASLRLHRWVRGDWQTVRYLLPRITTAQNKRVRNPLRGLHRWKLADNLRRSLVPPMTVLSFALGWLLLPGPALLWPIALLAVVFFPALFSLAGSMVFRSRAMSFSAAAPSILTDFGIDAQRALLALAVLPHQAWLMLDALVRALWRQLVSHKRLLEWETAAEAEKRAGTSKAAFWLALSPASIVAVALVALAANGDSLRLALSLPIALLWLLSPLFAWWVSCPTPPVQPRTLSAAERLGLRRVARKTWRFFDAFVVAGGHFLAPDNYQEDPCGVVAWRTSPTNMGLQMLAVLAAHDFGFIALPELLEKTSRTLNTMTGMERFRGHFLNWYDIRTLEPLRPAYVSTVDSGNLAGHLLVLREGLLEASEAPLVGPQLVAGLRDTARLALEDLAIVQDSLTPAGPVRALHDYLEEIQRILSVTETPVDLAQWRSLFMRLKREADNTMLLLTDIHEVLPPPVEPEEGEEPVPEQRPPVPVTPTERLWASVADLAIALDSPYELIDTLAPWAELAAEAPAIAHETPALQPLLNFVPSLVGLAEGLSEALAALDELASTPGQAGEWAAAVASGIRLVRPRAVEMLAELRLDADIARQMWEHTDFRLLYDVRRSLFSIGYNVADARIDRSYYDLLASECRLASYLAVAKGDVGQDHWFHLGRSLTRTDQGRSLVSWSASMFEYLMPLLVMRNWPDTLLEETYQTVTARQIAYGRERGVPWGVSESAFNAKDAQLTYQYQAFGIPGLGLKRGLSDDVVVAPYASMLALPVDPPAVASNLVVFSAEGAEGTYGYFESLDYTPGRVPAGETRAVVKAYFAHHQGMAFLALSNTLLGHKMQERFHRDPIVESAELLLQERVPRHVQLVSPHVEEVREVESVREVPETIARAYPTPDTPVPSTHFLSNGRYSVMVTNAGGGYSRWLDRAISRYREDVTRDCWGTFLYVRDLDSGAVFSAPYNPMPGKPDDYGVTFTQDKAEFWRLDGELETRVEVAVSPEDDVEVRRAAFTNQGTQTRRLEVTTYLEIALSAQASDQAHKSFSNLFIETEAIEATNAILFSRRPRSDEEERVWAFHLVACDQDPCEWSFETDRSAFLGRLRGIENPVAIAESGLLGGSQGAVLDPCCAIRREIEVGPGQTVRLAVATGAAEERDTVIRLTEKYHDPRSAQRAIDLSWTTARLELRDLGIRPSSAVVLDRLASRLLLTDAYSPLKVKTPVENGLPMSGLWSIGISGDLPILLVRVEELEHAPLVRQALLAHQYWRHKGLVSDLVILNTRPTGYTDALDDRLRALMRTGHALQMLDKPGGVFLRRSDHMHPDVLNLLLSVARATLEGDAGTMELQLNRRPIREAPPPPFEPSMAPVEYPTSEFVRPALLYDNGLGGFDPETGEYVIVLEDEDMNTPASWIDVLANQTFGCTVSEAGIGCTWALNSHENRITTWNNDPVSDGSGESIYVRDEETGEFWSPTPLPVRTPEPYMIHHGRGEVRFEHETHGIHHTLHWFVAEKDPVRVCRLTLKNVSGRARRLSVTQLVEWVLGDSRSKAQQLVVTWFDAEQDILTAHNHFNFDFPGRSSFLACDAPLSSWTASRTEFVGRNGRMEDPAAMHRLGLGSISGRYHDNCGALMTVIELAEGESAQVSFFLGQTATLEETRALVARYRMNGTVEAERQRALAFWHDLLGIVQVKTPEPKLDLLVNGQLLYQTLACRLWGRTATYQSSGAFGFRDQLQDVMSLLIARPDLVREQIVEASRHQFAEGDVLHWWQPYSGRGVRTHISDDRHWLPLVVSEYIAATGDYGVLDEKTAFIDGPPLPLEKEDAYLQPAASETAVTVYEHCVRALEAGRPTGAHGLPLMGGGDWNDGMNRVGYRGRGESVWLAWFLGYVLVRFADVCQERADVERAEDYRAWAASLANAAERDAWDGAWYRRAYFDDGTPLGSHSSQECQIDAIAQAWATISGLGDSQRAIVALDSVDERLIRREDGLIALLAPPFDTMPHDPGYIKGYVPGVRENGGQYTHAALWVALAYLLQGEGDEGEALLDLINPLSHGLDPESVARYKVEPYVVAADVYAVPPHVGRGGWTWYTGSASWFYRVAVQSLLGLSVRNVGGQAMLFMNPRIPHRWTQYEMTYRHGSATYRIRVENPRSVSSGVAHIDLDGKRYSTDNIPLADDGREHEVVVVLLGG